MLTIFCQQTENRPLAGVIVIGEGQAARAIALAGTAMKLPVLWAKGGTASLNGKHKEVSGRTMGTHDTKMNSIYSRIIPFDLWWPSLT